MYSFELLTPSAMNTWGCEEEDSNNCYNSKIAVFEADRMGTLKKQISKYSLPKEYGCNLQVQKQSRSKQLHCSLYKLD